MKGRKNTSASNRRSSVDTNVAEQDFVNSLEFNAPRELVFKMRTAPKHTAQWWGPRLVTNPVCEMDVRPGGAWRYTMHGPDGTDYPNHGAFVEVVRPERISYTNSGGK
jgi:uncharacterized protein YndB with AHSA1/START domain